MSQSASLGRVVAELDLLLQEETQALRHLDHSALDALTDRKVALLRELASASREGASQELTRALLKVRERALTNQMLTVHARDLTRGVFERLTGSENGKKAGQGRLLEVRG